MESTQPEIVSRRVFNAPRQTVFSAFSNPLHLARWWGPAGFTNTIQAFDLRPGGIWRLTMHSPDGVDYQNESIFETVERPERIVFRHIEPVHQFQMEMTFTEVSPTQTELIWRMRFESAAEYERVKAFCADANEQNFDRLAEHLWAMT